MKLLLFITHSPESSLAWHALELAKAHVQHHADQHANDILSVFFYQNAVHIANAFRWCPDDQKNMQREWQQLAKTHQLTLPVCVSAALARGITDEDNAKRHRLLCNDMPANNLATGFELVGLGELAEKMHWADKVITL